MGEFRSPLPPCITALGDDLVQVRTRLDEQNSIAGLHGYELQIRVKSTDLHARDAAIEEYLAKELKISIEDLQLTNSYGDNTKNVLVKGLSAAQVHERLAEVVAYPWTESLNVRKLHQLNSYIHQTKQYESITERQRSMEIELSAPSLVTKCKKRKLESQIEKCRANKGFALQTYKALERELLGYKKLVAVNRRQVEVICDFKKKKGWLGKVIIPKCVGNFKELRNKISEGGLAYQPRELTSLILGGLTLSSEKIWK